jgi:arsenate reductase
MKNPIRVVALFLLGIFGGANGLQAAPGDLLPSLHPYVAKRVEEFSTISPERQGELKQIARFIQVRNVSGEPAQLTFICTANSRRSQLAASWALAAARYYDVKGVRVFSGGLQVAACNPRTVSALQRAGFDIQKSTGGDNPLYLVKYSDKAKPLRAFSKVYDKGGNPTKDYLAAMTCANADKNCPMAVGSSERVAIHYDDPKAFDGTPQERAKYDETCRLIAREMFYTMSQVQSNR